MKENASILIIDDDFDVLQSIQLFLKRFYSLVQVEQSLDNIEKVIEKNDFDVILLDMNFSRGKRDGEEGFLGLKKILSIRPNSIVVLVTAYGDIDVAVKAMREGAFDFILKPWKNQKLLATISSALELRRSKLEIEKLKITQHELVEDASKSQGDFLGKSPAHLQCLNIINRVAKTDADILILGENGTGKEMAARKIHQLSNRSGNVFLTIDLGSLSETLFESELFGYSKGSFTDAYQDKPGKFELASGGTILLDEIGNLSLSLQSKLLQVLQNRRVTRIGSIKEIPVDFRLICATNKPLYKMVQEGTFREDLLYRINMVEINLPPLRKRPEDIELLFEYFINVFKKKYDKPHLTYTSKIMEKLQQYHWPGNVRELKHSIERAVILSDSSQISITDFQISTSNSYNDSGKKLTTIDDVEREHIINVIESNHGNITKSAKDLGVSRTSLHRRIRKYGI